MGKRQIQLAFFETACTGNFVCAGQWRSPGEISSTKDRIDYYVRLAQLATRGKILCVFFADSYGGKEVYGGSQAPLLKAGTQVAQLDPVTLISALGMVTKTVCFGITGSTSYLKPYMLARTWSSLDHLTNGRVGWNVVTSYSKEAAFALGHSEVVAHDKRYEMADEFMDVLYKLWESSWADDAAVWDKEQSMAYNPDKVHKIEHDGQYLKMSGTHQTHPSPQRTPFLFQAGTSRAGQAFAAKHAEAVFMGAFTPSQLKPKVASIRASAAEAGRDPRSIKVFAGITLHIGRSEEEAQAKYATALKHADYVAGLAQFSGHTGIDMSQFPPDEIFKLEGVPGEHVIRSVIDDFQAVSAETGGWTPRKLGLKISTGGMHPAPVGSVAQIADYLEEWVETADIDGFNISAVHNPGTYEDVVDLLVPELQKRGLMWADYAVPGGTFRENLYGKGQSHLRDDHYGHSFKWKA